MDTDYISTASATLTQWIEQLSSPTPAPGGGAAGAVVLAIGAATAQMAAGYAAESGSRTRTLRTAQRVRELALRATDDDAAASAALAAAYRNHSATSSSRAAAIDAAGRSSIAVVRIASSMIDVLDWLSTHGEPRLLPDVAVSAALTAAAIRTSCINIASSASAAVGEQNIEYLHSARRDAELLADRFTAIAANTTSAG
ncbi:formiminotetrahydrofolate cyclodeaminase [Microbacterium halimionae]|uniref:Formiminotetrahydrofolate cyclodeaminase n=1 Tax=Microbacterium halimionae TaxID=1526413 RepID=A0A7W3JR45_9MICO|nr:cyclodeaminase/cyclohydrolase family protein [Microbacterium halimionae]MBA8817494.1 formiminotetrahydrofolate cyclodeaminase [Microbacterium halimionae]NII95063.1 formiminotetrahydrofolate cyclodeaminase [Microbacterium halimionae]